MRFFKGVLWLFGCLIALAGVALAFNSFFAGLFIFISGVCTTPASPLFKFFSSLEPRYKGQLNKFSLRVLPYLLPLPIFFIGIFIFAVNHEKSVSPSASSVQAPAIIKHENVASNTARIDNKKTNIGSELPSAKPSASLRDKIDDYIFTPYTKSQYSKTFSKFGSRMGDVEKARQAAAFLAAASGKCTFVDMSEVSDASTRNNIKTFTDCRGLDLKKSERFRFEESELKDAKGRFITEKSASSVADIQTIEQRAFSQDAALKICRETVRKSAKFPSSVDFATFGQVVNTSQGSGETWVELDFEAKNGLGAMLPYKANCGFPIHGKPTFSVSNR